jgi:two-component system, sensor histidine kinase YesM
MKVSKTSKPNVATGYRRLPSSLYFRLVALFFPLVTVPFLISIIVTYNRYSASLEQNSSSATRQVIEQVSLNLDRYVRDLERITLLPFYDNSVLDILKNHNRPYGTFGFSSTDEQSKMNLFLSSISFDRTELRGISIFANDGSLFDNVEGRVSRNWLREQNGWMTQAQAAGGGLTIISPHRVSYYTSGTEQVIALARLIRDPFSGENLGFVKADLTEAGIAKILNPVNLSSNARLYVTDRAGSQLYPSFSTASPESKLLSAADNQERLDIGGQPFLNNSFYSDFTGLRVTGLVPFSDLRRDVNELTGFTLLLSLLAVGCAFGLAAFFSARLLRPVRHLQHSMKLVEQGDFAVRARLTGRDEIGQLAGSFNAMVGEIDRLVKEVYETRLRERDAELAALQSQINPHFLYNTLETMNMLALERNAYELSDLATNLGRLLRYTVDKKEQQVFLRDELQFVEAYLQIQSLRYGDRLQVEISVDPALENCLIPRLILQPLVENALLHGIGAGRGTVRIGATVHDEDELRLSVEDDGAGITDAKIADLERQITAGGTSSGKHGFGATLHGFALPNVHGRLRLLYGEPYGLHISRLQPTGSRFELRLPFVLDE